MTDVPNWLNKYVKESQKYQKQSAAAKEKQEASRAKLRPATNPYLPPLPREGKKVEEAREQTSAPSSAHVLS